MNDNTAGSSNPYAAPAADLSKQADEQSEGLAGRGSRLGAAMIDGLIMSVVTLVPLVMFMGGWSSYVVQMTAASFFNKEGVALFSFLAYLAVNGYFLARDGQSIGKKLVGIKIVCADGTPAGLKRIALRRLAPVQALQVVPYVGPFLALVDVLFIFRDSHQCLHDQIADTKVVKV